jgi:hypothetical protein
MFKTIKEKLFPTEKKDDIRLMKELLRENLGLVPIDIFYIDDPKLGVPPDKLADYYKKFYDICRDKEVIDRINYLINKQARLILQTANTTGAMDGLAGININGMASVKDDFTRLANSYLKEMPNETSFNNYKVI